MKAVEAAAERKKIEDELSGLPDACLVYKKIRGREQPYLQWHEDGKTKSRYVKVEEREQILITMARREELIRQKKRLAAYSRDLQDAWKKYPGLHTQNNMTLPVGVGIQYFAQMMEKRAFYIDKSMFIKAWWEDSSTVNLITRPRRFGKSLNLDMLDCFFSDCYAGRRDLFRDLQIWECRDFRRQQGTWPVIHLDFSGMKTKEIGELKTQMTQCILDQYYRHHMLQSGEWDIEASWTPTKIEAELKRLCRVLSENCGGKKVIILIDEYDTPIQESWGTSSYEDTLNLMRRVFHCLLKSNPYLEKGLLTGITRVSRESLFSDLNNLRVSSVLDDEYSEYFGFTEEEVFAAMDSQSMEEHEEVKRWYDGFTIGNRHDIYNPWSITNYLQNRRLDTYWANTSANTLVSQLIGRAAPSLKRQFAGLMDGQNIEVELRENILWEDLERDESLIWGLLLSTGYITGECIDRTENRYRIRITNQEVTRMFRELFLRWFSGNSRGDYQAFIRAMFAGDEFTMQEALNEIMLETFSFFDVGGTSENRKTENFYHGFVLGMVSSLREEYHISSNRESGYGRYDVMLEPRAFLNAGAKIRSESGELLAAGTAIRSESGELSAPGTAVLLEFKVCSGREKDLTLTESAQKAVEQIRERDYPAELRARGIPDSSIRIYGIAFRGKQAEVCRG